MIMRTKKAETEPSPLAKSKDEGDSGESAGERRGGQRSEEASASAASSEEE
jgi:hypothetical protein